MREEIPECCNECYAYGDNSECQGEECDKRFRYNFEKLLETSDEHFTDSGLLRQLKAEMIWI